MIFFGCMKFIGVDMRGKYIKMVIPRISKVFQHVLKTHFGMYECMEFMPKFLRWWVTNLAGWRYSPVKPLFGIWNHSMEHELRIHQWAAHWGKDPWQFVLWTHQWTAHWGEGQMENVLKFHHWTAHWGKALCYTNWKFLSDLHIWGKEKGPVTTSFVDSSRFVGHVQ